jgi:hypothetical protein
MKIPDYEVSVYGTGDNPEVTALIAGVGTPPDGFEQSARSLVNNGSDVVAYTYSPGVLFDGEPERLPNLMKDMNRDFDARAQDYTRRRYAGFSLGVAIAGSMQRGSFGEVVPGLYAGACTDLARLIMRNTVFRAVALAAHKVDIKRRFTNNGYTEEDLRSEWAQMQEVPSQGFALVIGGADQVVSKKRMREQIRLWQAEQAPVAIKYLPFKYHDRVNKWFLANIVEVGRLADSVEQPRRLPEVSVAA